jgi:hypothetical protein
MNYFNKLPTISYNGYDVKNILARAQLSKQTKASYSLFYPYTLTDDDRIDRLSKNYYENPGYSWLVWLANETIDPYYGLSVSDFDLVNLITSKYGSLETAARKIKHYRIDWINDTTELTPEQFDNYADDSFNGPHRKYFEVVLDSYGLVKKYVRKQDDSVIATNQTIILTLTNVVGTFVKDEEVQINNNPNIYAFVKTVDGSTLTIQHTTGFPVQTSIPAGMFFSLSDTFTGYTVTGKESRATGIIDSGTGVKTMAEVDSAFWSPVTYLDYEYEENAKKKYIQLIGSQHKNTVEDQFKRIMKRS